MFSLLLTCFTVAAGRQAFSEPNTSRAFTTLFQGEDPLSGWIVRRWDDVSERAESRWEFKDGILHGGEPRGRQPFVQSGLLLPKPLHQKVTSAAVPLPRR